MPKIAVIGAGTIGASWAESFAAAGWDLAIVDPAAPALPEALEGFRTDDLARAVRGADLVQESAVERLEPKRELLMRVAEAAGDRTVIASSTSTLLPGDLAEGNPRAAQIVVGHPFNPPEIMPLVEVVPGPSTATWVVEAALEAYRTAGRRPVALRRQVPGFVGNRLQKVILDEAVSLVQSGIVDQAELDEILQGSLGLRWAGIGLFEGAHLGGGPGGLGHFLEHIGPAFAALQPGEPDYREDAAAELSAEAERTYGGEAGYAARTRRRDVRLRAIQAALRETERPPSGGDSCDD